MPDELDLTKVNPQFVAAHGPAPKEIDLVTVHTAAGIGCTNEEIAALCKVSPATFYTRLKSNPLIQEAIDAGSRTGKASMRRKQFETAMAGNATMQIWWGKQYLGQRDTQQLQQLDAAGRPADPVVPVLRVTVTRASKADD